MGQPRAASERELGRLGRGLQATIQSLSQSVHQREAWEASWDLGRQVEVGCCCYCCCYRCCCCYYCCYWYQNLNLNRPRYHSNLRHFPRYYSCSHRYSTRHPAAGSDYSHRRRLTGYQETTEAAVPAVVVQGVVVQEAAVAEAAVRVSEKANPRETEPEPRLTEVGAGCAAADVCFVGVGKRGGRERSGGSGLLGEFPPSMGLMMGRAGMGTGRLMNEGSRAACSVASRCRLFRVLSKRSACMACLTCSMIW